MTSLNPEQLDQRIADSIAHATAELRDEFRAQLLEVRRGADSRSLVEGLRRIDAAETQSGILKALLEATEPYSRSAALLLNTGEGLRGWGMRGLDSSAEIEKVSLRIDEASPWANVVNGEGAIQGDASELYAPLGGIASDEHTLVPLVLRGQVAAVLATDGAVDTAALQALTYSASQAIETLGVRESGTSATLRRAGIAATGGPPAAPPLEATAEMPVRPIEPPMEAPAVAVPTFETSAPAGSEITAPEITAPEITAPEITAPGIAEPEIAPPPEPEFQPPPPDADPLHTVAIPQPTIPAASPVEPVQPSSAGPAIAADGQILPPEDIEGPGWAFSAKRDDTPDSGDSEIHEEARRLARLLVSEIKLYNEEQVEEGRQANNIYTRLKEDIDRSRQIYEERIHDSIRGKTDYFKDELVRILAGGDADVLGM